MGTSIHGVAASDHCGQSVAISADGRVLAVGEQMHDPNSMNNAGRVRVYGWDDGTGAWQLRDDIPGAAPGDFSGKYVALSADGAVLAVGEVYHATPGATAGRVRVHDWDAANGAYVARSDPGHLLHGLPGNQLGWSLDLSADGAIVAYGDIYYSYGGGYPHGYNQGRVLVFEWVNGAWTQRGHSDDMRGASNGNSMGRSVALSADGEIVAVGVPFTAHPTPQNYLRGEVHVYAYDSGTGRWNRRGTAHLGGVADDDNLGHSVAISADGNVVAAGAYKGNSLYGYARVYAWDENSADYAQRGNDIDGTVQTTYYGESVSLSADGAVVAVGGGGFNSPVAGAVGVYAWNGVDTLEPVGALMPGPDDSSGQFGKSVALSADATVLAVGAPLVDIAGIGNDAGRAYAYAVQYHPAPPALPPPLPPLPPPSPLPPRPPPAPRPPPPFYLAAKGYAWTGQDLDGAQANEYMGFGLALSADGLVVAAGGYKHNGGRGHVLVYEWNGNGNSWQQIADVEVDGAASNDMLGYSVALSADGAILAVSEHGWPSGAYTGKVRTFVWDTTEYVPRGTPQAHDVVNEWFGISVALSNDGLVLAVAAEYGSHDSVSRSGFVRVFAWNDNIGSGGDWEQRDQLNGPAASITFGRGLAMSGDGSVIAVGAPGYTPPSSGLTMAGYLSVWSWNNGAYVENAGYPVYGDQVVADFGHSVALSADGLVVAAVSRKASKPNVAQTESMGYVRVFANNGMQWAERGDKIWASYREDFTDSVALNADGSVLAVGSSYHDLDGDANRADNRGHARVFAWNGGAYDLVGDLEDVVGEAYNDQFGHRVALSGDCLLYTSPSPRDS